MLGIHIINIFNRHLFLSVRRMLTNTNIACSSRVHEITRDNGGFPCLFACFREAEEGGIDRSTVYCNTDNEKI